MFNRGEKAFVPYIMAGDGGMETLKKNVLSLQEAELLRLKLEFRFPILLQMALLFKKLENVRWRMV